MNDGESIRFKLPPIPGAVDDPNYLPPEDPVEAEQREEARSVLDPVERLKESHDTKNLTVGEMKARDEDNIKLLLESCRQKMFNHPQEATMYAVQLLFRALEKLGLKGLRNATPAELRQYAGRAVSLPDLLQAIFKAEFVKHDVRIDVRQVNRYTQLEQWKAGCYIYHGNEIAYFISNPRFHDRAGGNGTIIIPGQNRKWWITTNVPAS